jgi:hypothetical protein
MMEGCILVSILLPKHRRRRLIFADGTTSIDDRGIVDHSLTGFAVRCELHLLSQADSYLLLRCQPDRPNC